ncbi:MAG TPA: penicillin-binding protein [Firmicutes bacterium]|nr:penicillin-binding protein [Bacillota bacterium]
MPIRKRRKRRISPYHHLLRWLVVFLFILGLAGAIFVLNNPFIKELDVRSLLQANLRASTVIDRHGEELLTLSPSRVIWTPLEKIPFFLRRAVVAVEDRRFYEHRGVDFIGILRAVYYNLRSRQRVQGGSTITQQLAKNLLLSNEKTISRKLLEVGYAVEIERKYSKDEILEFYLNDIYFGHGVYGVESAARFYFAKHIWELTMEEQAVLVGLIRGPEFYSPYRRPEKTLERRNLVLEVLLTQRYISEREYEQLSAKPLIVQEDPTYLSRSGYFADYIEEWLAQQYAWSYRYIRSGGLRIYTTLDAYTQRIAEETISSLPRNEKGGPEGALVALNPKSGEILAMVGGRNYRFSKYNRAVRVRRQIGSAIKPLVFAAGIEAGFTPETKVIDEPVTYLVNGKPWSPQNFDNKYRGIIPLRDALAWSVNTVAVRLVDELGVKQIFSFIQRMGLPLVEKGARNDQALAPLALGGLTEGVTPIELCSSFTALANQGIRSLPVGVIRVEDDQGRVLRRGSFRQEQVIRAETAWAVTDMMQGVITYGTGRSADPGRPAAGKTGTSNENTDAWFVGFTPELVVVLWIGNDDRSPLRIGERIIGGGTAAEYWGSFVRRALVRNTVKDF